LLAKGAGGRWRCGFSGSQWFCFASKGISKSGLTPIRLFILKNWLPRNLLMAQGIKIILLTFANLLPKGIAMRLPCGSFISLITISQKEKGC
jgi:hypothetical protein